MDVEQPVPVAQQPQRTLVGKLCRWLFTGIFYLQLTLIPVFVIFLTLRGLVFTKSTTFLPKKWYTPLLSSVAVSGILSLAWQCFFVCNIRATVKATFWFTPILTMSFAVFVIMVNIKREGLFISIPIVPLMIYSVIQAFYSYRYIGVMYGFTFRMMTIATGLLPARTRAIAVVSAFLSVFYSGFLVAGIGGATASRTRLDILYISIIMISLAWTMQVLKNIQLVAISKARYVYFKRAQVMNACDALGATLRNHIGNVCIGSTLVPFIVLYRLPIRGCNGYEEMYTNTRGCSWIANHLVLYGNRYGFVHVGAYNKGFGQASRDTWTTFRRMAGLELLIDSDLTSSVCFCSGMSIGAISAYTAGIWQLLIHKDYFLEQTLYAFIIGYFVGRVSSAWLQACVMGYYVAYSEDPQNANFDDTIPLRIQSQNSERAKRAFENIRHNIRLRVDEDEEITHV